MFNRISKCLAVLVFVVSYRICWAETVVLKTGGVIEGKVIQNAQESVFGDQIKVESQGQVLTLSLNDIQTIDGLPPHAPEWLQWKNAADTYWHEALIIIDECSRFARSAETFDTGNKNAAEKTKSEFSVVASRLEDLSPPQELERYHVFVKEICQYCQNIIDSSSAGSQENSLPYWRKVVEAELNSLKELKGVYVSLRIPQVYIKKIDASIKDIELIQHGIGSDAYKKYAQGIFLASEGKIEESSKVFEEALQGGCPSEIVQPYLELLDGMKNGESKTAQYARAVFEAERNAINRSFSEAIQSYEKALQLDSRDFAYIYEKLAFLYVMAGRYKEADALLEKQKGATDEKYHSAFEPTAETKTIQEEEYLLFVPSGISQIQKAPFVFAMSPNANAQEMIDAWRPVAERKKWIVFASRVYRNGIDLLPIFERIEKIWQQLFLEYPIDTSKIIATGMSGGGMGAHFFSFYYPNLVSAIIVNTGMIESHYKAAKIGYPQGKVAALLASPTDFRYKEMQSDKEFLEDVGWEVKWIEFPGGHIIAPEYVYQEAADWVDETLQKRQSAR